MSPVEKKSMIVRDHPCLTVSQQCRLVKLSRSTFYYAPIGIDDETLVEITAIDKAFTKYPFFGSRMITQTVKAEGTVINRKRVQRLMRVMGLESTAPKPNTSTPAPDHPVYPYLLRGLTISRPNQAWATDITYIPMARGFLYLVAIMDWHSRYVLAWRLSNTLDTEFCVAALEEALQGGRPEIFNTDQGSQFTSEAFTGVLKREGVRISMDGKGRYLDNLFVERLWRTVKYEEVYLKAYAGGREAKAGLDAYFRFYNTQRPHQALGYRTPAEVFTGHIEGPHKPETRCLEKAYVVDSRGTVGPSLILAASLSS